MQKGAIRGNGNKQIFDGIYYEIKGRGITINDTAIVIELIGIIKQLLAERQRYICDDLDDIEL